MFLFFYISWSLLDFLTLEAFFKLGFCSRQNMQFVYVKWEKGSDRYPALQTGFNSYSPRTELGCVKYRHSLTYTNTKPAFLMLSKPNQSPRFCFFHSQIPFHMLGMTLAYIHGCKTGFTESSSQRQRNAMHNLLHKSYISLMAQTEHKTFAVLEAVSPSCPLALLQQQQESCLPGLMTPQTN